MPTGAGPSCQCASDVAGRAFAISVCRRHCVTIHHITPRVLPSCELDDPHERRRRERGEIIFRRGQPDSGALPVERAAFEWADSEQLRCQELHRTAVCQGCGSRVM